MATPIIAETIKSTRSKDKITIHGFIYTPNKSTNQLKHWVCEKRGTCKARITTNFDMVITKPKDFTENWRVTLMDQIWQGLICYVVTTI